MPGRRLSEHQARFRERDGFLYAVLGLEELGTRFERLIHALETDAELSSVTPEATATALDESVYVVAGALALWQRARGELGALSAALDAEVLPDAEPPTARSPDLRGSLLR